MITVLSERQCRDWLTTNLGEAVGKAAWEREFAYSANYAIPVDTGKKTAVARVLSRRFDAALPGLLWITAWGIFPSSENMSLFDGYRRALGENRPLHVAPGHVFDESGLPQIECLLDLALYFSWDASLFSGTGSLAVKISHDEYLSVHAKTEEAMIRLADELQRLDLKRRRTR